MRTGLFSGSALDRAAPMAVIMVRDAHAILDSLKAGASIPPTVVNRSLVATGDLKSTLNKAVNVR